MLAPPLRRFALATHLTLSIGWLGSVIAFLALAVAGTTHPVARIVRSACLMMDLLASYIIVPLAFASLASALVSALGTKWGLFRHYWVLFKLMLTVLAIAVLVKQLGPIADLSHAANDPSSSIDAVSDAAKRPLVHAVGGIVVLLVIQLLGVYKPWGKTGYARQQGANAD